MNTVGKKFGEFEVVHLDSARHRHRGVRQFAVRDANKNYLAYCHSEQEAEAKAKYLDGQKGEAKKNNA